MRVPLWVLVGIGGFAGSVARYWLGHALPRTPLPWGVLAANVAGSFLLGVLFFSVTRTSAVAAESAALLGAGFLGGFTTMSAFAYDTALLAWARDHVYAALNVVLNVAGSIGAVFVGRAVGRLLW